MASDGLFDVMRDQCVIETVSKHIRENKRLDEIVGPVTLF